MSFGPRSAQAGGAQGLTGRPREARLRTPSPPALDHPLQLLLPVSSRGAEKATVLV